MSSQSNNAKEGIAYLFERPTEPVFNRKGEDADVQFVLPNTYYTERYKDIAEKIISTRGGPSASKTFRLTEINPLPDISLCESLPRNGGFSVFNDFHRSCAVRLIEIFLDAKNVDQLFSLTAYVRDRVNSYLYVYALSIALLHRNDTKDIPIPSHLHTFPHLYVDRSVFPALREEQNIVPQGASKNPIDIPRDYTSSDLDLEHRVAYFREDVGVNLHHWHWHLVYPLDSRREIVNKDRRGELFYYMHEQILARYNTERLCNHLARTRRLANLRDPIEEGYYPKLDNGVASRPWPSRHPNTRLSDINREKDRLQVDIQDLERWTDRIYDAIHSGRYTAPGNNTPTPLNIDILGNMIESNILSVNRAEYGNLHNQGHNIISYVHDPENQFLESFAVMGDSSTAMRDPVFYRWHTNINYIFEQYKHTLTPYSLQQLNFENVQIQSIKITASGVPENEIATFWQQATINIARGLDFAQVQGAAYARLTHLQHAPFTYNITVQNSGSPRTGTVRIFYAPKFDERGERFLFRNQKGLFIELDRFTYNLKSGVNTITRKSVDSSVTIPYEQTFRDLSSAPTVGTDAINVYNFCGCGWPQHMLIAKGNTAGFACELFVMISNYQNDSVQGVTKISCDDASSYCGIRDSKYPDRQAMGFPFDRLPRENVEVLQQFLTPNMAVRDITIRHSNRVVAQQPPRRKPNTN